MLHSFHVPENKDGENVVVTDINQIFRINLPRPNSAQDTISTSLSTSTLNLNQFSKKLNSLHAHFTHNHNGDEDHEFKGRNGNLSEDKMEAHGGLSRLSSRLGLSTPSSSGGPGHAQRVTESWPGYLWCGSSCFALKGSRNNEPPEITYCTVDEGGTLNLQSVTPALPMPDDSEEINRKFEELVDELDLSVANKAAMMSLPDDKKWQIFCSKRSTVDPNSRGIQTNLKCDAKAYIEILQKFISIINDENGGFIKGSPGPSQSSGHSPASASSSLNNNSSMDVREIDGLHIALRTQPNSFVTSFIENGGLNELISLLSAVGENDESALRTSLLTSFKSLMNNSYGRAHVLSHETGINVIAQSLSAESFKAKIAALELLGAICLVPGGHKKVLEAMLHYQTFARERTRFQGIVNDLDRSMGRYHDDVNLKTLKPS